jgi:hypothetical protein
MRIELFDRGGGQGTCANIRRYLFSHIFAVRLSPTLAAILLLGAFAGRAEAAKKSTGREALEKSARKACMMGNYQKGTEILSDLFIETKDITYVYNQARCLEQNHRWEEALDRFLEYQRKTPGVDEREKSEVEQHVAECKSHLKEQAAIAPPPIVPASPRPVAEPAAPAVVQVAAPASTPERARGMGLRVSGITVGVVGLGAIATGVILAAKTRTLTDELNKTYNRDKAATRDSYETWGWVSYGVGAAALVTGTTLCILGWRSGKSEPQASAVSVLPILSPGTGGVLLRGAY